VVEWAGVALAADRVADSVVLVARAAVLGAAAPEEVGDRLMSARNSRIESQVRRKAAMSPLKSLNGKLKADS